MGKPPTRSSKTLTAAQLARLRRERRKVAARLSRIDDTISKALPKPRHEKGRRLTTEQFNRLLDELSEGLDHLPTLPPDWSRADLYDDHD